MNYQFTNSKYPQAYHLLLLWSGLAVTGLRLPLSLLLGGKGPSLPLLDAPVHRRFEAM